jgi:hypothetical protein
MAERQLSSTDAWIRWVLDECPENSIPYVLRYFGPYKQRLENLLRGNRVLNHELTLQLSGQLGGHGWNMHAVLRMPKAMIVAVGSDETLMGTMDQALDSLWTSLKRHLAPAAGETLAAPPPQDSPQPRPRSRSQVMGPTAG